MVSLEEYKLYASITKSDKDSYYQSIIDASTVFIEKYTNLSFTLKSFFDIVSITESSIIVLDESPVFNISQIMLLDVDGADLDPLPTTQYFLESESGLLFLRNLNNINTSRMFNARVNYIAGLDGASADIKQACMDLVTHAVKREYMTQKRSSDNSQISFTAPTLQIPPHIGRVLDAYRNYV